jgi:RNA polymerase sigma-70 factor (ECF subfamily)
VEENSSLIFRRHLAEARAGDEQARNFVILEAWERVRRRSGSYAKNRPERVEVAIDLVGNVVGRVSSKLGTFRQDSRKAFRAWVARIYMRELATILRKQKRVIRPIDSDFPPDSPDSTAGPSTRFTRESERRQVRKFVAELSPKLREVVQLRYIDDLSFVEIAKTLGCTAEAAMRRHERALRLLAKRVGGEGKSEA